MVLFHMIGGVTGVGLITILLADLGTDVDVEGEDDEVGDDVETSHAPEDVLIVEWDPLGKLHEHEDDSDIGTIPPDFSMLALCSCKRPNSDRNKMMSHYQD